MRPDTGGGDSRAAPAASRPRGVELRSLAPPRTGQVVLSPVEAGLAPASRIRTLYRLSDPALSEMGLEDFLDELLVRVREALAVDTVAILLLDPETNELEARAAKGIEEEVEQGVRIPVGRGFAGRIAAERVAIFIADVDHADVLNPLLREKGIASLLGVPLIVEGDLIGVMHVGSLTPRDFGREDLAVLQAAAARAAPGIERARLFSAHAHEHRVAMMLQRSLLPKVEGVFSGVEVAARYLPATDEVGGDWYDVFELPRGRMGIAIGDVVGHGVRAAALMSQLRTALHAYALEGHDPARTLTLLDRLTQSLSGEGMATAAYAVLDRDTGQAWIANAGHLPPLVIGGERPRLLDLPHSPPLGAVAYAPHETHEISIAAGETLLFYTDGMVERPRQPLDASIERLLDVVRDAASPEEACALAFERLIPPQGLDDDAAVVGVKRSEVPEALRLDLPAQPEVLVDVRRALRSWLRHHRVGEDAIGEVTLAVGEACTNAIEHAYSPAPARFQINARLECARLLVCVADEGNWRDPRGEHRGRGLTIMRAVMDEVDVRSGETGTEVAMRKRL